MGGGERLSVLNNVLERIDMARFSKALLKKFKPDFRGRTGAYFRGIGKKGECGLNAEVTWEEESDANTESGMVLKPELTGHRWLQFLSVVDGLINSGETKYFWENGRAKVIEFAETCGFEVKPYTQEYFEEVSNDPRYKEVFDEAKRAANGKAIDGFSFPKKKKIFYSEAFDEGQRMFTIAHELTHFLLGHRGTVFCKISGSPDSAHERKEYNEEADKLAAMILMPHGYMKENQHRTVEEMAEYLNVPPHAVKKRRKEVTKELNVLHYGLG